MKENNNRDARFPSRFSLATFSRSARKNSSLKVSADLTSARRQELEGPAANLLVRSPRVTRVSDLFGRSEPTGIRARSLSRRVHTRSIKYLTWRGMRQKRAESARHSTPRDRSGPRALCSALVPLLLGTISNWPRATIARGRASERRCISAHVRVHTRAEANVTGGPVVVVVATLSESETSRSGRDGIQDVSHPVCAMIGNDERTASAKWQFNA